MSTATTSAPAAAKAKADALPMPWPAPVTNAIDRPVAFGIPSLWFAARAVALYGWHLAPV